MLSLSAPLASILLFFSRPVVKGAGSQSLTLTSPVLFVAVACVCVCVCGWVVAPSKDCNVSRWLSYEQSQTPPWMYLGLVKGCTCFMIAILCALFGRPKDVQGCSAAPEEFSPTAFLVLLLSFSRSQRVCLYGARGHHPTHDKPTRHPISATHCGCHLQPALAGFLPALFVLIASCVHVQ